MKNLDVFLVFLVFLALMTTLLMPNEVEQIRSSFEDSEISLPILISLFALLISYFSYRNSTRRTELQEEEALRIRAERETRRVNISLLDRAWYKSSTDETMKAWATRITVFNQGNEVEFIRGYEIELEFLPAHSSFIIQYIHRHWPSAVPTSQLEIRSGAFWAVGIVGLPSGGTEWSLTDLPDTIQVENWETGDPLPFRDTLEFRGPAPGEKQGWVLYAHFPEAFAKMLYDEKVIPVRLIFRLVTDKSTASTTAYFQLTKDSRFIAKLRNQN